MFGTLPFWKPPNLEMSEQIHLLGSQDLTNNVAVQKGLKRALARLAGDVAESAITLLWACLAAGLQTWEHPRGYEWWFLYAFQNEDFIVNEQKWMVWGHLVMVSPRRNSCQATPQAVGFGGHSLFRN